MWWYTDKHVDVIFTRLCFQYFYLFLIAQFSQYFADIFFYFTIYYLSSIFWFEYNMVLATVL